MTTFEFDNLTLSADQLASAEAVRSDYARARRVSPSTSDNVALCALEAKLLSSPESPVIEPASDVPPSSGPDAPSATPSWAVAVDRAVVSLSVPRGPSASPYAISRRAAAA